MARPHTTFQTLAALVLLGAMAVVFVAMGNWQTRRAAERDAIALAIQQGRSNTPVMLTAQTPADQLQDWRPAIVTGRWEHQFTVLLDNRNYKGRPGYWVATPLRLDPANNTAVLVLRGWLARTPDLDQTMALIPRPDGTHTVTGEMLHHVPRLFELWSLSGKGQNQLPARLPSSDTPLPTLQNLDLDEYGQATDLQLLPVIIEQTSDETTIPEVATDLPATGTPAAVLLRDWPEPSLDADKNRGYALQWYGFALIATGAWLFIAWRAWRRRRAPLH
jgi:cytochrome oxidase assembly protein ShyY1